MKYRTSLFIHFFSLFVMCPLLQGQISGTITDADGLTLPYVNVFIEGTTTGTASNMEGFYLLDAPIGSTVIFRYIGFSDVRMRVAEEKMTKDIVLATQPISMEEIVIAADAEDPAYPIIRKAIALREYHRTQVKKHSADTYAKGLVKMLKTPQKILGQEIGDMEGVLDTAGRGIVYLSESQSRVYVMAPDLIKEEMYSSKVSGSDGSFNINRLSNVQFDIYEEYFNFNRTVINPLADQALTYYKYRLEGVSYDEKGREINKIAVIPKSANRPVGEGYIYIADDSWNVVQVDLFLTGKALKEPMFDTINIRQQFLPVGDDGVWRLFSQEMGFTAGAMGFKVGGTFSYIFSNYDIEPEFDESFFGSEVFLMEEGANMADSAHWEAARPIPLTDEEKFDYIKKDSLRRLWDSKEWKDSIDHINNKFVLGDFLFGYNWANTFKRRYLSFDSPLSAYRFNVVEGHAIGTGVTYSTSDSTEEHQLRIKSKIAYGFSDERIKVGIATSYRLNRMFQEFLSLDIGDEYRQYYNANPVQTFINTYSSLLYKENNIRLYNSRYVKAEYQRELVNGLYMWTSTEFEARRPLSKNTDFSFFSRDKVYLKNNPERSSTEDYVFDENQSVKFQMQLRWRPGQTYSTYNKFRIREQGKLPSFYLIYNKGFADTDYDKLKIIIEDKRMSIREFGFSQIRLTAGTFLRKKQLYYMDLHHFMTNENTIANLDRYLSLYKLMPHYEYSSSEDYITVHYEHHFNGYVMDKVPLLKNLGAKLVLGANTLQMKDKPAYYEGSVGIDQLKLGVFSVFRMDYTWSFTNGKLRDHGFFLGLSTNIGS